MTPLESVSQSSTVNGVEDDKARDGTSVTVQSSFLSTQKQHVRRQFLLETWRILLWLIAIFDIVWVSTIIAWMSVDLALQTQNHVDEFNVKLTIMTIIIGLSYIVEWLLGMLLIIGLVMDVVFLVKCLELYLTSSCLLLVAISYFIMSSITTTMGKAETPESEEWSRILINLVNMIYKFLVVFIVKDILIMHYDIASFQRIYELSAT